MTVGFSETEERQELRKQVAKLAGKYGRDWFTEKARAGEKTTELWLEIGKNGYLGINIPEQYGGGGGGVGGIPGACGGRSARGWPPPLVGGRPAVCGPLITPPRAPEDKKHR